MNINDLGYRVDSSQLAEGTRKLDALSAQTKLNAALKGMATATKEMDDYAAKLRKKRKAKRKAKGR
jgi:hypothetical protein